MVKGVDTSGLPGGDLVNKGVADLSAGRILTEEALLVAIGAPRLRQLGIELPETVDATSNPEHALFGLLETRCGARTHSAYNALIRRLTSFEHALVAVGVSADR